MESGSNGPDPTPGFFRWPCPTWAALLTVGAVSRILVVLAGVVLGSVRGAGGHESAGGVTLARREALPNVTPPADGVAPQRGFGVWYQSDGFWYADIGVNGYFYTPGKRSSVTFFPLLPAVIAAGAAAGAEPLLVGLIAPNAAFVFGFACLGRLVFRRTHDAGTVWWCGLLLSAYPFSYYFSAPYQESLCFCTTAAALLALEVGSTRWAALAAAVATTARLAAVALPIGLVLEWAVAVARGRDARSSRLVVAVAGCAGIAVFYGYLYATFGDFLCSVTNQTAWGRQSPSTGGLLGTVLAPPGIPPAVPNLVAYSFLGLGAWAWWRHGALWGSLILIPVAQALATGTFWSIERIALSSWPAFYVLAELVRPRPWFGIVLLLVWVPYQVVMLHRFVHGGWVA